MSEKVNIGFDSPGSIWVEVENPNDLDEVTDAFVEKLKNVDDMSFGELIETDPEMLVENIHYVDSTDGEVYQQF